MKFPSRRLSTLVMLAAAVLGGLLAFSIFDEEVRSEPTADAEAEAQEPETPSEETQPEQKTEEAPASPTRPKETDKGIFSEFDKEATIAFPSWLEKRSITVVDPPGDGSLFAFVEGTPVGFAHKEMGQRKEVEGWGKDDADKDGIPDALDILLGAKKTALNKAKYQGGYKGLDYPGGDVPRTEGVCTDVLVRAVRNAGIDLQKELHEDIKAKPKAYPMVKKADPNIDQRRVRTLLPYFERKWTKLGTDPADKKALWAPGDVVFMNTMGDKRPDHVGIVSDTLGDSGRPSIINNWTNGYHTQAMDLLGFVPVTHRFRVP